MSRKRHIFEEVSGYHFKFKHLLVIFAVLTGFLVAVSLIQKSSLQELLINTQEWYRRDAAERLANLSATSLELLLETTEPPEESNPLQTQQIIQAFNIVLSQQILQQYVESVCILVRKQDSIYAIDDGQTLYRFFFDETAGFEANNRDYRQAIKLYRDGLEKKLREDEQIFSVPDGERLFHVFVPFVPRGEFAGAIYIRNIPDFTFITQKIITSYDETAILFAALIILGLLAMFYISSYSVRERDETQQLLFQERETHLLSKMDRDKEALFTRRIYHTHHKAEKVMGFIKEDLHNLAADNIGDTKNRVNRYANFISRVIYDMKWYDPPLQTIRNPLFRTDLNELLAFISDNIFLRTSRRVGYRIEKFFDLNLPAVQINEFVVWEIFEPLLQNCVEHSGHPDTLITIRTSYDARENRSLVEICDNGNGIAAELLELDEQGVKRLFAENNSTKNSGENAGYGCYIAHQIATRRCGWELDAGNLPAGGACFTIVINH